MIKHIDCYTIACDQCEKMFSTEEYMGWPDASIAEMEAEDWDWEQIDNTAMKNLSNETKTQAAVQMVIMDAIEKGHTNANELTAYMRSGVFAKAVKRYISMFNEA